MHYIWWHGKGPWAIGVPAILVVVPLLFARVFRLEPFPLWLLGALFTTSGVIVFIVGRRLNNPIDNISGRIESETGKLPDEPLDRHGMQGARMEIWGLIEFLVGAFLFGNHFFEWYP